MRESAVELSLFFFSSAGASDVFQRYELLMRCVELADQEGLHAVWIPERHFSDFGALFPNPSVLGAAIAATTRRIGIRAGSVVVSLHDPLRLVEEWSVVDNLSGGRVGVSFATGWNPDDFVLQPHAYADRRDRMAGQIATVRSLWSGATIRRCNGAGEPIDVFTRPKPLQPELPVWLTAVRAGGFEHAAKLGTNVLGGLMELREDELAGAVSHYRALFEGHGAPHVTLTLHTYVDAVPGRAAQLARQPLADYLGTYLDGSRSAIERRADLAGTVGQITVADRRAILRSMADRYIATRSMIGTPAHAVSVCRRMRAVGVDEVACLVDFGLPPGDVLAGIEELLRVRDELAAGERGA
jgi:natural product biosynthesis luciferase-like monooxygenase protein